MRYKSILPLFLLLVLSQALVISGYAQSNIPGTATQVPGPSSSVAPIPASYIINGLSPVVNFVRERDGMGRITDTIVFASAGYVDVRQTTQFFDGLGRPWQTVVQQVTPGNNPADLVTPVVYD